LGEECSKLSDQRKPSKLQWLQNPSQMNGDHPFNVMHVNVQKKKKGKKKQDWKAVLFVKH
jgi:hypothetical protein